MHEDQLALDADEATVLAAAGNPRAPGPSFADAQESEAPMIMVGVAVRAGALPALESYLRMLFDSYAAAHPAGAAAVDAWAERCTALTGYRTPIPSQVFTFALEGVLRLLPHMAMGKANKSGSFEAEVRARNVLIGVQACDVRVVSPRHCSSSAHNHSCITNISTSA